MPTPCPKPLASRESVLVAVPVFDHGATLPGVVRGILAVHPHVLVVDDGSAEPVEPLLEGLPVRVVRHEANRGKGAAILTAAVEAQALGMTHIVTIDADGQHDPAEVPRFLDAALAHPLALVVGRRDFDTANVPGSSRFGRTFSNFWLRVQTGVALGDVQSGFRAYPVCVFRSLSFTERRYSFEVEVLVRASWAGFELREVDISVYYPPREERVSHFRALWDNVLISLLNTRLTMRSFLPLPHRRYGSDGRGGVSPIHPLRSLRILLSDDATPMGLGLACALGMFLGTLPLIALHSIAILFASGWLRLNKIAALAASQLCMPPLVPALCVETGYFLRNGEFLTEISLRTLGYEALDRLWEWVLGSLLLAPALAVFVGAVVYAMALGVRAGLRRAPRAGRGGVA